MSVAPSVSTTELDSYWELTIRDAKKRTQLERYEAAKSAESILKIIRLGGGPAMGTTMEKIARYSFKDDLLPRAKGATGHDHRMIVGDKTLLIEQKSAGLWSEAVNDFKWQHIEVDHKWDFLLLAGIQYNGIDYWAMSRANFLRAVESGLATNQGNKAKDSSEGIWMTYANVSPLLHPIKAKADLVLFVAPLV